MSSRAPKIEIASTDHPARPNTELARALWRAASCMLAVLPMGMAVAHRSSPVFLGLAAALRDPRDNERGPPRRTRRRGSPASGHAPRDCGVVVPRLDFHFRRMERIPRHVLARARRVLALGRFRFGAGDQPARAGNAFGLPSSGDLLHGRSPDDAGRAPYRNVAAPRAAGPLQHLHLQPARC